VADNYLHGFIENTDNQDVTTIYSVTTDGAVGVRFTNPGAGHTVGGGLTSSVYTGIIWYAGDPSTPCASVPNAWLFVDHTNADTYVKTGAPGSGTSGTITQT